MRQLLVSLFLILSLGSPEMVTASDFSAIRVTIDKTLNPRIDRRIQNLDLPVEAADNDRYLQRKLKDLLNGHASTERMLGRAERYFPIFEQYLCEHDVPTDLKYLAVVESMLQPRAKSGAGAVGLWQFMPTTARALHLRVDRVIDERLDPHRASDAAARMLKELHDRFSDWHLVVAAYNCGPTRVSAAIRRAGGNDDYERVKRYLPRETRDYVGAYVAAAYTLNFHESHGLNPSVPEMAEPAGFPIFKGYSIRTLAKLAGMNYETLRQLNPSLVQGYLPASDPGIELRLPLRHKHILQEAIWGKPSLVLTHDREQLAEAEALARVQGFDATRWLTGCHAEHVIYTSYRIELAVGTFSEAWLNRYGVVAML